MKLYYTDPLAAAYMAGEFGIELGLDGVTDLVTGRFIDYTLEIIDSCGKRRDGVRFTIHPDSYHIFEPKVGDLVTAKNDFVQYVAFIEKDGLAKCNVHPATYLKNFQFVSIIQRDGEPFFTPEEEL